MPVNQKWLNPAATPFELRKTEENVVNSTSANNVEKDIEEQNITQDTQTVNNINE